MAELPPPTNMQELLVRIETEWSALMSLVDKLDSKQMLAPDAGGWSPKDNLAHITVWMNVLLNHHFGELTMEEALGIPPVSDDNGDFDAINAQVFEKYRGCPLQDVLNELSEVYKKVLAHLKVTPFEELMKPRHVERPDVLMLHSVIGDTYTHFAEHRETIKKVLRG